MGAVAMERTPDVLDDLDLGAALAALSPEARAAVDALLAEGATAVLTFREFVDRVNPRFVWYDHCVRLAAVLQRFADGELRRVIVQEPPRHGKSEMISRLLPAYLLYRYPDRFVALASYAAELAYTLSRAARGNYERFGRAVASDAGAVKHWETTAGGGLWAAGFGGPATGKGFHFGIIDDPIKNAEEAASQTIGARNRDWYQSTWYTRGEPDAAMLVVATRWPGPGDLIGWLLEQEADGEEPEGWHVVSFEAIKDEKAPTLPATCTLEPDPRQPGEALCPPRYPLERLRKIAKKIGDFFFAALFQQRPRPRGGTMFPRDKAEIVEAAPAVARRIRYWDKAGTKGGGKYSAGARLAYADGIVYVEDVKRGQWGSDERNRIMRQTAELDGTRVTVWTEQEPGSGGKESAEYSVKLLAGFSVHKEPVTGDKVTRAEPFAAQWQAGNVKLVRGPWNEAYLAEMEAAPHGDFLDQMDASSGAFNKIVLTPEPRSRLLGGAAA